MAVIKNNKTGMWEVRTYYKDLTGARKQKTKRGLCQEERSLRMGAAFQTERGSEYQHELQKFCGYLFDGFRTENKAQYFSNKEAHY